MLGLTRPAAYLALALTLAPSTHAQGEMYSIHGSGTTNPSKCFWNIMSRIEDQSHAFTRLTYRAVGSGTGQIEFIGTAKNGGFEPANDFGAGDIPLSTDDYNSLKDGNGESTVVHLPFVVSGVSFFHSVPNVPKGSGGLNLTSCLLAQIFNGSIQRWDDNQILAKNPGLRGMLPGRDYPITVAHRVEGSSSTKSITQYLNLKCPDSWSADQVNKKGKEIVWAPNSLSCDSSSAMTACIRDTPGTIGYMDAGHGWEEDLTEIELENADGVFVSSLDSFRSGGTGVAATKATSGIGSFDEDFNDVSLLDQPGRSTWPILVMSYVYIRTNIAAYESMTPANLGLLRAFMKALYNPLYIDTCKDYGFTPVPEDVKAKALDALDTKVEFLLPYDEWTVEDGIEKIIGQGEKKISPKRRDYGEFERSRLSNDVADLISNVMDLNEQAAATGSRISKMENFESLLDNHMYKLLVILNQTDAVLDNLGKGKSSSGSNNDSGGSAALVLAALSFAFWCAAILYLIVTKFCLNM